MSLQRIYAETLHESFPIYYANFPPNQSAAPGDFGAMVDGVFSRQASMSNHFGLGLGVVTTAVASGHFEFSSKSGVSVENTVSGSRQSNFKATATFKFAGANGVFFSAADCQSRGIDNEIQVFSNLMDLFKAGRWDPAWVLVVGVVEATALTLLVSAEKNAKIELEAQSDKKINFADAQMASNLRVSMEESMAHKWVGRQGTVPFLRLAAVRRKFPLLGRHAVRTEFLAAGPPLDLANERKRFLAAGEDVGHHFEVKHVVNDDAYVW